MIWKSEETLTYQYLKSELIKYAIDVKTSFKINLIFNIMKHSKYLIGINLCNVKYNHV